MPTEITVRGDRSQFRMPPRVLPDCVTKRIPAGSKIVLQLHYTPRET